MINFDWTAAKFFWYTFFTFCTFLYFTLYGMMAVALTPNSDIAAIVSTAFYAIWNLFAGFVITRPVSFIKLTHTDTNLFRFGSTFYAFANGIISECRGYRYGGDGTSGHAQLHGPYTVWLLHNSERRKHWWQMLTKQWRISLGVILATSMTSWVRLLQYLLPSLHSLLLCLLWESNFWTSKGDELVKVVLPQFSEYVLRTRPLQFIIVVSSP